MTAAPWVQQLTNDHPDFYRLVGPWLSRRDIVAELGHPVWDDPGKVWFVAMERPSKPGGPGPLPIGMGALTPKTESFSYGSFWTPKARRGEGIGSLVLAAALKVPIEVGCPVETAATLDSVRLFYAAGFVTSGQRGRYTLMRREADT